MRPQTFEQLSMLKWLFHAINSRSIFGVNLILNHNDLQLCVSITLAILQ